MVAVVDSVVCPWLYLGLFAVVKSELRRRCPGGDDEVVCSVIFCGASLVYFSFVALSQNQSCVVVFACG